MKKNRDEKFAEALAILRSCIGEKGVWADPTRYRHQCWTRDFAIAIVPLLYDLGWVDIARKHLLNLSALQRPNGQIPILFLDDEAAFVAEKERKSREQGRPSFMLERYRAGELWNLTPGTRDSEIAYLVAVWEYFLTTADRDFIAEHQLNRAGKYVEEHLMRDGLVIGCDWRDTMEKQLGDKALLTNNCLLYHAYHLIASAKCDLTTIFAMMKLRERILKTHTAESGTLLDYPGYDHFDPLGAAFAVLYGVAGAEYYAALTKSFREVDTDYGVTIKCRHNPVTEEEKAVIERTDGVVVWPFIVGFTVLALLKMGEADFARQQFRKLVALDGFREWYDPATGKGYGAQQQLWSATLFARASMALDARAPQHLNDLF